MKLKASKIEFDVVRVAGDAVEIRYKGARETVTVPVGDLERASDYKRDASTGEAAPEAKPGGGWDDLGWYI